MSFRFGCGYGDMRDQLIRDLIVVGICDDKLSEKMQLDPELTLEKAISLARQSEAVKKQQPLIRDFSDGASGFTYGRIMSFFRTLVTSCIPCWTVIPIMGR
jgi:hypothetical protein